MKSIIYYSTLSTYSTGTGTVCTVAFPMPLASSSAAVEKLLLLPKYSTYRTEFSDLPSALLDEVVDRPGYTVLS